MKKSKPSRHGSSWHICEIDQLRDEVENNFPIDRIAEIHERTEIAISMAMDKYKIFYPHSKPQRLIINGVDYDRKIELAKLVVQSVIDGNHKFIRVGSRFYKEVI